MKNNAIRNPSGSHGDLRGGSSEPRGRPCARAAEPTSPPPMPTLAPTTGRPVSPSTSPHASLQLRVSHMGFSHVHDAF